jgi:hypothetical protein
VDASDEGIRVYEKAGFKVVGKIGFDPQPYGDESKKFPVDTVSFCFTNEPLMLTNSDHDTGCKVGILGSSFLGRSCDCVFINFLSSSYQYVITNLSACLQYPIGALAISRQ